MGKTNESHFIRTIEYWDIERRRDPQYDHCAVIVTEEITSRFLNVIDLFNGFIPLIALQMKTVRIGDSVSLIFTTVLDELTLGFEEEDEGQEIVDRGYWETKGSKQTLLMIDRLIEQISDFAPGFKPKYNKYYIGMVKDGRPNNFVSFKARKNVVISALRLRFSQEIQTQLENAGLDVLEYNRRWRSYRVRLTKDDLDKHLQLLTTLMKKSYEENVGEGE